MFPGWELLLPNPGTARAPRGWVFLGDPCPLLFNQPPKKQKFRIWEVQVQLTAGGEVRMGMRLCRRAPGVGGLTSPPSLSASPSPQKHLLIPARGWSRSLGPSRALALRRISPQKKLDVS